ncbi:UDP-glucosyltransferase 2-like [Macrobrachium nipponense]|uniref:UDP-glucosyltransferase 2-like n=1 Tax=Macrobrachium nipponense TaxID=159736 RepID=UPI0030C7D45C
MACLSSVLIAGILVPLVEPSIAKQYNLLVLCPIGPRSVYRLTLHLSEILANAGHLVTHVSTYGPSSKHPNVTEVPTGASVEQLEAMNIFHYRNTMAGYDWIRDVIEKTGDAMWRNEHIRHLWARRRDFDAVVILSTMNEIAGPFLMDYNGAFVTLCSSGAAVEALSIAGQGNWLPLSVIPNKLVYDDHVSFLERLTNVWRTWALYSEYEETSISMSQKILERYIPGMPPVGQLFERVHLTLINGHFALDGPMPLLPTQVEIGTITAKPPKPLPSDLEEFAESAGDSGIILFTLGSYVKSSDIPNQCKVIFLEVFRRLPQKVIWKYEEDDLDLPPNVITRKWLPQQDILGHPKTRLFMSHCGNFGVQEAKYHGVPILGFPVAFDQNSNAVQMANKGLGLVIRWEELTRELLFTSIQTLINDPSYAARMKRVSEAAQDQKETAAERAIWWIEYAIRCNARNCSYAEYGGKTLHFFQYVMADVAVFLVLAFLALVSFSCYVCACAYRIISRVWRRRAKEKIN